MVEDGPRIRVGSWVSLVAPGPVHGVVMEDAGSGMLVVQVVVGEWMLAETEPISVDEDKEANDVPDSA